MNHRARIFAILSALGMLTAACSAAPETHEVTGEDAPAAADAVVGSDEGPDAEDLDAPDLEPNGLRKKRCCILKDAFDRAIYCNTMTGTKAGVSIACAGLSAGHLDDASYVVRGGSCGKQARCEGITF